MVSVPMTLDGPLALPVKHSPPPPRSALPLACRRFPVVEAKQMWESFRERETRGKKAAAIAAQHNINLTTSQHRSWYEATWMETVVNWTAVADLLDKVAPGWDAAGVSVNAFQTKPRHTLVDSPGSKKE
jgi:hypothetical protein